jgi:RNA polymerase sigma-70 factor (TIGR02957 family)
VSQNGAAWCLVGIALESEEEPTMAAMPRTAPEDRGGSERRGAAAPGLRSEARATREGAASPSALKRAGSTGPDPATEAFLAYRNLLFTVAYELLGSAADAEDVLQETWLRWAGVDLGTVRDQRAYLVRVTTRQALTRLRALGRRRESYVGPWLPEPLLTAPDVAEDIELADSVSMALLLVLETLTPTERAVFVLREVFDLAYDEIAEAVGKSPAAVRQIGHRAREHVAARRPRGVVSPAETRDALEAFRRATETGDLQGLLDILAPDVVFLGDGGGVVQATLAPVVGAGPVARLLAAGLGRIAAAASLQPAQVNGYPALILRRGGEIDAVIAVRTDDGLITGLYAVRNPEKLLRMEQETSLRR